ncbi:copper homeostasis protein CutC, partial [Salmonella enterica]|uniref:copper homeostasis protein CutC n=1 Tax=Salmonella enterica TaxID=28901 RepID=UPI00398C460C
MALLEICCYSMECALTAQRTGADRIELCAPPKEEGLTPSFGVLRAEPDRITTTFPLSIPLTCADFSHTGLRRSRSLDDVRLVTGVV